jgi:hypothetical protein
MSGKCNKPEPVTFLSQGKRLGPELEQGQLTSTA